MRRFLEFIKDNEFAALPLTGQSLLGLMMKRGYLQAELIVTLFIKGGRNILSVLISWRCLEVYQIVEPLSSAQRKWIGVQGHSDSRTVGFCSRCSGSCLVGSTGGRGLYKLQSCREISAS